MRSRQAIQYVVLCRRRWIFLIKRRKNNECKKTRTCASHVHLHDLHAPAVLGICGRRIVIPVSYTHLTLPTKLEV